LPILFQDGGEIAAGSIVTKWIDRPTAGMEAMMKLSIRTIGVAATLALACTGALAKDEKMRTPPGKLDIDIYKPDPKPKQEPLYKPQLEKRDPPPTVSPAYTPAIDSQGNKVHGGGVTIRR
jgi:hypothetical protein